MHSRRYVLGVALALLGASVALAAPSGVGGTYDLTGTEDGHPTKVALTVGEDGSVRRAVTYADSGSVREYAGKGTVSDRTLTVDFPLPSNGPSEGGDRTDLTGTWAVRGANGVGPYTGQASFARGENGAWVVTFNYAYDDPREGTGSARVDAKLSGSAFAGKRLRTTGLTGALSGAPKRRPVSCSYTLSADGLTLDGQYAGFRESFSRASLPSGVAETKKITATYSFDGLGAVDGSLSNGATEHGAKKDNGSSAGLRIVSPASGKVLVGQVLEVVVEPKTASYDVVSGPGRRAANGKLQITGKGELSLVPKGADGKTGEAVKLVAIPFDVVEITVDGSQPIADAPAPHSKRTPGSNAKPVVSPAAILLGEKLTLKVTLKASDDLTAPAKIKLTAEDGTAKVAGEGSLQGLKSGQAVTLVSERPFADAIDVKVLDLAFKVETEAGIVDAGATNMPLRVYVLFQKAVRNGPYFGEQQRDLLTKNHCELVCNWAKGASKNIGNGDASICWHLDNYVRHHVHPVDFKPGREPFAPAYPANNKTPPVNYADLDGSWEARSSGERPVGQIYYPPLEVKDPAKEDYSHFSSNFGWWLLDNPTHTGGRCNQQASLMCDMFGTMGVAAKVHYLQRVGTGTRTGRPVRQYFNSSNGGQYWNFHGLARATLADGSSWLYDGSFSWAPDRKNGLQDWAEAPGRWLNQHTPFIYEFGPWYYEDWRGGVVPIDDIPTRHVEGDNPGDGEFTGVKQAKGEDLAWYNKKPPH